ncbi:MAG: hypothetical protein ACTSU2_08010 [Promethearchaeota archaeon]
MEVYYDLDKRIDAYMGSLKKGKDKKGNTYTQSDTMSEQEIYDCIFGYNEFLPFSPKKNSNKKRKKKK